MSTTITRDYDIEDLQMLQQSQVFHNAFVGDKAAFVADFPHLDDPFASDMQSAIDLANAIPSATENDAEIAALTYELNAKLPLGRKAIQKLYVYVELAWPKGNKNNVFGRNKYEKARQSQLGMKDLLEQANRQAEKAENKTALLNYGYTQAAIDELKTISDDIDALNEQQEDMLAERGDKTYERIIAYNNVWEYMKQINKASKVTFADNPAKLEMYMLYPTGTPSLPKVQNFIGVLESGPVETINMSWDLVAEALEYEVERSQVSLGQPQGTWSTLATVQTLVLADEVPAGRSNYYRVRAKNLTAIGAWANTIQVNS